MPWPVLIWIAEVAVEAAAEMAIEAVAEAAIVAEEGAILEETAIVVEELATVEEGTVLEGGLGAGSRASSGGLIKSKGKKGSQNDKKENAKKENETKTDGCPISMLSGEELLKIHDATLPGIFPFSFERFYRTAAVEVDSKFGHGWCHALSHELTFHDDYVAWRDNESLTSQFPRLTESRPSVTHVNKKCILSKSEAEHQYQLKQKKTKTILHFERQGNTGKLVALSDYYGNRLAIYRNDAGDISHIVNESGLGFWFVYQNGGARIARLEMRQLMGDDSELIKVCQRYQYNDRQQLIAVRDACDEGENYDYDAQHVISLRQLAGGLSFFWQWEGEGKDVRAVKHWNLHNYSAEFIWDDKNKQVTAIKKNGSRSIYQHDQQANLIYKVDPDGAEHHYAYDHFGNLVETTDPLGGKTYHAYNSSHEKIFTLLPDERAIEYIYEDGHLSQVKDNGAVWRYQHNPQGDIIEQINPLGEVTRYQYTAQGQLARVIYPDESTHALIWDHRGQLIEERCPDGTQMRYQYDACGRLIRKCAPKGRITHYTWDPSDRLIAVQHPDQSTEQLAYNAYDEVTEIIDALGQRTQIDYFENSHLISQVTYPTGACLRYRYDNAKNFVTEIRNEKDEVYQIDYYPNGLVKEESTFDGQTIAYRYDLNGYVTEKTATGSEGGVRCTQFERDIMGRLLKKTLPCGQQIDFKYDGQGQLTHIDDGRTPLFYRYDPLGRVVEAHQGPHQQHFAYDPLGQLQRHVLPDQQVLDYRYHAGGALKSVMRNGEMLSEHQFSHGRETARHYGSIERIFEYDEQDRLKAHYEIQKSQQRPQGGMLRSQQYRYDASGNLTARSDQYHGTTHYHYDPLSRLAAVSGRHAEAFIHDAANNLLRLHRGLASDGPTDAADQTPQAPGNRLSQDQHRSYRYDEFGALIETRIRSQRKRQLDRRDQRYQYDASQQLTRVALGDGSEASYQYDALGRRIHKTVKDPSGSEQHTEFIWQGDRLIAERSDAAGYRSYLYEPESFRPLALLQGEGPKSQVYYYHLDATGTPIDLTDANGKGVWSAHFSAYGELLAQRCNQINNPLRFQGQYFDNETNLHYNRYRYYAPQACRYITPDPIGLAGGLNPYQYCTNPIGWVDPLGLAKKECDDRGQCEKPESEGRKDVAHPSKKAARRAAERQSGMGKHGGREQLPDQPSRPGSRAPRGDPGIRTEYRSKDTGMTVHHDPYGHKSDNIPPHYGVDTPGGTTHHTYPSTHNPQDNR